MKLTLSISLAAVLLPCSTVAAQDTLERVEQGFEDLSPLARSLEFFQPQLQQPTGFESVYRVPGSDGLFMRRDGAIHAIFDRSEYIQTRRGALPTAPAGTIYSIGPPSHDLLASLSGRPNRSLVSAAAPSSTREGTVPALSSLRITNRLAAAISNDPAEGTTPFSRLTPPQSAWTNDLIRQRQLSRLLTQLQDSSPRPATADD